VSWRPTGGEIADRYADARARVVSLVADISDEQTATPVPGTPRWTVRELVSHMVGGPVDFLAGNLTDAGGESWTQAQVEARRGRSVASLLDEWDGVADGLDTAIRDGHVPAPVSFDVITHEQDLRGALGAPATPDPLAVRFVTDGFAARVERVVAKAGLPPLQISDPAGGWCRGPDGGLHAEASEFEWFRALTGRRSTGQVSTFAWSGDPAPYLDLLSPFGPLRHGDVQD
jgi:uncharacterized protein (TIGR03083 family)